MYVTKERRKPFMPSAGFKGLLKEPYPLEKESTKKLLEKLLLKANKPKEEVLNIVDAETGEPLQYTKAKWSAKEGRLSLNAKTIIEMGTGKLDISKRSESSFSEASKSLEDLYSIPEQPSMHPLVQEFLNKGPLTFLFHQHWDPVSDSIVIPEDNKNNNKLTDILDGLLPMPPAPLTSSAFDSEGYMQSFFSNKDNDTLFVPSSSSIPHTATGTPNASASSSSIIPSHLQQPPPLLSHHKTSLHHHANLDDHSTATSSLDSSSHLSSFLPKNNNNNNHHHNSHLLPAGFQLPTAHRLVIPDHLEIGNRSTWENIALKIYHELVQLVEFMERNKSLTKENPTLGGISSLKRICKNITNLRVAQMKELVQAVDDEAVRDQQRENAELEVFDKPKDLAALRRIHQEKRRIGKQYIEALQRDHEIVFIIQLKEAGFLW